MNEISEIKINEKILLVRKLKDEADIIEKQLDAKKADMKEAQLEVDTWLEERGIPSLKVDGAGTYYLKTEFSYKIPADPENKKQAFEYFKDKFGEDIFTINSQTFNKICKELLDAAVQTGDDSFTIPGVEEPKPYKKGVLLKR